MTNFFDFMNFNLLLSFKRLMQKRYDEVCESKLFYKEQWSKAFRDINKIRRDKIVTANEEIFAKTCDR